MIPFNHLASTRHGFLLYHRMSQYIGSSIDRYGEFSPDEVDFLTSLVGPGSVVLDGGANIGALTIPLAKAVGLSGTVVAVEPQRLTFQALCANVALNSLSNVYTMHAALGAMAGSVVVPRIDLLSQGVNEGGLGLGQHTEGERVPVVRIDDIALPGVTLLKLDLEGMERAAISGARKTIKAHQPILYVENDREAQSANLIRDLKALRYRLFWHTPPLYRRDNFRNTPENVFGKLISINMLCLPEHDTREFGLKPVE